MSSAAKVVKAQGPYRVMSCADGSLSVLPTYPDFPPFDPEAGGGPGVLDRLALAQAVEDLLNSP